MEHLRAGLRLGRGGGLARRAALRLAALLEEAGDVSAAERFPCPAPHAPPRPARPAAQRFGAPCGFGESLDSVD